MRIAIVTDAWRPQVNGVVTTLSTTAEILTGFGHRVAVLNPAGFKTFPCPTYPEIQLAWRPYRKISRELDGFEPERIHIATEGTLGMAARRYCRRRRFRFTTSYHTNFPQYLRARFPVPVKITYRFLRWFHGAAARTMVTTERQQRDLEAHGLRNIIRWDRGVDTELFRPGDPTFLSDPRPVWVYMGRVSVEKSLDEYLSLDLPGTKYVIGDGPASAALKTRYPDARFTGYKFGAELAAYLGACDVFVFPSRTETFGLVMLEAMACGLPVAAFPVVGPVDVVDNGVTGVLNEDLRAAALAALELSRDACRQHALRQSWPLAIRQFERNLVPTLPDTALRSAGVKPSLR
jgi:glycosyltransferase involved in cell wall biosynthesis